MALNPDSEPKDLASPEDYALDHPHEHPEMWGWHGEWGRKASWGAGIVVAAVLLLMFTATHYNASGLVALGAVAIVIVAIIFWDARRKKNAWRK